MKLFIPFYSFLVGGACLLIEFACSKIAILKALLSPYLTVIFIIAAIACVVFVGDLIILIKNRGFMNYFDSIEDTITIRNYAKKFTKNSEFDQQPIQDMVINNYNSALSYSYVDYRKDSAICMMRIPSNADAEDLLKKRLKSISNELHDSHFEGPDSFNREHGYYILRGRKKNKKGRKDK